MKHIKMLSALALVITLALLSFSLLPQGTVKADPGSGLLTKPAPTTLATGTTSYTTTGNTSLLALNVFDYGSIQIQAQFVMTGSQVVTVVPQFSNQPSVNCLVATSWVTATDYQTFPTYTVTSQVVTSTGVLTSTASTSTGSLTTSAVDKSFTVTGNGAAAREIPTQGRCFRLKLDFDSAGQVYTPTVYVRPVNRY